MNGRGGFSMPESIGPARTLAVLLLAVVLLTGCGNEVAYTDLPERDVNEMIAVLYGYGIAAEKSASTDGRYDLLVDGEDLGRAVDLLGERGFPRKEFADLGDMYRNEGLLSSPLEERARFVYAHSQSVAQTLSLIDGVIAARVHFVMPENDPFAPQASPSSAAVFIKYNPEVNLEPIKADIKLIVQKSIEGLAYDRITVVMLPAQITAPAPPLQRADDAPGWFSRNGWGLLGAICLVGLIGYYGWGFWRRRQVERAPEADATATRELTRDGARP